MSGQSYQPESYRPLSRDQMAWRAAQDLPEGAFVNLGIGIPTLTASYVPHGREVIFHSENGVLGLGPKPEPGKEDPYLIDAGKNLTTLITGGCYVHHADAFLMIRGGHLDLCVLGALEVAENGDLANWMIPGKMVKGMGGAMDLVAGVKRVVVLMEHTAKGNEFKILSRCSLPLTGVGVVDRIITELGVLDVTPDGLKLVELAPEVSFDELQRRTGTPILSA